MALPDTDFRGHVRNVRALVDSALANADAGREGMAGAYCAEANLYLAEFVRGMGHADIQTAKMMANELARVQEYTEQQIGPLEREIRGWD